MEQAWITFGFKQIILPHLDQIAGALKKRGNLAKVQFKTDDEVTGEYEDLYLERPMFQEADMTPDGNVVSVIAFREKTELEKRVDAD